MDLLNFQLGTDGISVDWEGHNLDLHNNYDFISLSYSPLYRRLEVYWRRSDEEWAKQVTLLGCKLIFEGVTFFKVRERGLHGMEPDDVCLASLSFHAAEERDEFESISQTHSVGDDLTCYFESEWGFKVNAQTAELFPLTGR